MCSSGVGADGRWGKEIIFSFSSVVGSLNIAELTCCITLYFWFSVVKVLIPVTPLFGVYSLKRSVQIQTLICSVGYIFKPGVGNQGLFFFGLFNHSLRLNSEYYVNILAHYPHYFCHKDVAESKSCMLFQIKKSEASMCQRVRYKLLNWSQRKCLFENTHLFTNSLYVHTSFQSISVSVSLSLRYSGSSWLWH